MSVHHGAHQSLPRQRLRGLLRQCLLLALLASSCMSNAATPVVIAHRGASGYLPEHTLAAKAAAHAMGADYLEQDVVLSADGVPLVLHDIHLDTTTDVAQRFPGRARPDGRYYAIDFTLAEIHTLQVGERRGAAGGDAAFSGRFPVDALLFRVVTLDDELRLVRGLNHSTGRAAGIYLELKAPQWHADQGQDMLAPVLAVLRQHGYEQTPEQVMLQCFDDATLKRLHDEFGVTYPLVQLIGENSWGEDSAVDYDHLQTPAGLREIARYARGIGPWIMQVYRGKHTDGTVALSSLVDDAHNAGLLVHPFTVRSDQLPAGIVDHEELLDILLLRAGVDGLFTDFPDRMREFLQRRNP